MTVRGFGSYRHYSLRAEPPPSFLSPLNQSFPARGHLCRLLKSPPIRIWFDRSFPSEFFILPTFPGQSTDRRTPGPFARLPPPHLPERPPPPLPPDGDDSRRGPFFSPRKGGISPSPLPKRPLPPSPAPTLVPSPLQPADGFCVLVILPLAIRRRVGKGHLFLSPFKTSQTLPMIPLDFFLILVR